MRLIIFSLAGLLVSTLSAQTTDYRDTLEVEIGDGAKVIFLANDAAGFEAIDRYDLNFIFDELWRRRQAGEQGLAELSKEELEQLQEGLAALELVKLADDSPVASGRRRFYLNLNYGLTVSPKLWAISDPFFFAPDNADQIRFAFESQFQPSFSYEMSLGTDFAIALKNGRQISLKTALGWSSNSFQLKNSRIRSFHINTLGGTVLSPEEVAQVVGNQKGQSFDQKISMFLVFFQAIPNYDFTLGKRKRHFSFGIGPRVGLAIRDSGEEKLDTPLPLFAWSGTFVNIIQPKVQYAVVNQLKYRSLHLYAHFYPRAYKTVTTSSVNTLSTDFPGVSATTHSIWSVGLKVGI